jgi:hypothetical protein
MTAPDPPTTAMQTFWQHLAKQHTPDSDCMTSWLQPWNHIHPTDWDQPTEPIQHDDDPQQAFDAKCHIGWDQFFHGHLAIEWKTAIATYYCTCNLEYHGDKGTLSQECIQQATALLATSYGHLQKYPCWHSLTHRQSHTPQAQYQCEHELNKAAT